MKKLCWVVNSDAEMLYLSPTPTAMSRRTELPGELVEAHRVAVETLNSVEEMIISYMKEEGTW